MPDNPIATAEDVQHLGQLLTPAAIGQQIATLMQQAANATRIALQCRLEAAKLLSQIAEDHGYKNKRFTEFALAHGVGSRTDAYDMLLLTEADDDVLATPEAAADQYYEYPRWRTVWREIKDRYKELEDRYWLTPPELHAVVRQEIGDDYHDPCPYPCPPDHDALQVDWCDPSYLNAPFICRHELKGRGLTVFVHKAIVQGQKGKTIAVVLPVHRIITAMLEAGASVKSVGRVAWLHTETGRPTPRADNCLLFVLRPTQATEAGEK